jgi:hypothetical protein
MLSDAIAACQASTLSGYGQSVSAVGYGLSQAPGAAVPANACGAFWEGATSTTVLLPTPPNTLNAVSQCDPTCTHPNCLCDGACPCDQRYIGCVEQSYCVMEPLAPRVEGSCSDDSQCQPGFGCSNGSCVTAGHACVTNSDCPAGPSVMCVARGIAITGICQ